MSSNLASLFVILQLLLSLRAQPTPPSQPPAPEPLAAGSEPGSGGSEPQGSPGASAPFSWPANGNVYCCSQWYDCWSGYHCEAFYPSCRGRNCQQPYSRCVPNCPYGETWVDCYNCPKENYCYGGTGSICNPPGYCKCNQGTYRVDGNCVGYESCPNSSPFSSN